MLNNVRWKAMSTIWCFLHQRYYRIGYTVTMELMWQCPAMSGAMMPPPGWPLRLRQLASRQFTGGISGIDCLNFKCRYLLSQATAIALSHWRLQFSRNRLFGILSSALFQDALISRTWKTRICSTWLLRNFSLPRSQLPIHKSLNKKISFKELNPLTNVRF